MSRKVKGSDLTTRTGRSKLKKRHKPYYRLIAPGLHLGYRKVATGAGTWLSRRYNGKGAGYSTENLRNADGVLVVADDYDAADGVHVLNFEQAQRKASGARRSKAEPLTVNDVLDSYVRMLEGEGRSRHSIRDTVYRTNAFIRPQLGKVAAAVLTTERLRNWRDDIAKQPARLRTRKGGNQKYHPARDDADRKRRATANRLWSILRAALNHAFHDGKVEYDMAWRKVRPFKGVGAARVRYLTVAESKRLINACDQEFRPLVRAGLYTGARYSELGHLQCRDFDPAAGTIAVRQSKSGKPRHVILTDEGRAFFHEITLGRPGDEAMLRKADGTSWGMGNQLRPMADAVRRAKIKPAVSFHGLRHTWASLSVMNGVPLLVVAKNLGHSDTRMVEVHYGHLAASYVADAIRQGAPSFGYVPDIKVATIR
jgi:integrase